MTTSLLIAPTLADVYAARPRVARVVRPTPLMRHPLLAHETGLDIAVKHENHNPTGAFKIRGGLNLIGGLTPEERRGVITATTGNHGQSLAYAGKVFGRIRSEAHFVHDGLGILRRRAAEPRFDVGPSRFWVARGDRVQKLNLTKKVFLLKGLFAGKERFARSEPLEQEGLGVWACAKQANLGFEGPPWVYLQVL